MQRGVSNAEVWSDDHGIKMAQLHNYSRRGGITKTGIQSLPIRSCPHDPSTMRRRTRPAEKEKEEIVYIYQIHRIGTGRIARVMPFVVMQTNSVACRMRFLGSGADPDRVYAWEIFIGGARVTFATLHANWAKPGRMYTMDDLDVTQKGRYAMSRSTSKSQS